MVYIDITEWVRARTNTGIQRVIKEFLLKVIVSKEYQNYYALIYDYENKIYHKINENELNNFIKDVKNYKFKNLTNFNFYDMSEKDIFFDMDSVWNVQLKRAYLYKELKKQNVTIVNFIHDVIPILLPDYAHKSMLRNYVSFLIAVYKYSDLVLCNSRATEKSFFDIYEKLNIKRTIHSRVVKLGGDLSVLEETVKVDKNIENLINQKYILFVGTIEPRKEHELVFDTFKKLTQKYDDINLVFVGKEGWNSSKIAEKFKRDSLYNKKFFWLQNLDDANLQLLYKKAFVVTYLSKFEGYGLPIAESLNFGNITISSKNSSMYEVAKDFADYVVYNTENELYDLLGLYLENHQLYKEKKKYIKENYVPHTWDMCSSSIMKIFKNFNKAKKIKQSHLSKLQFVFISIDVENIKGTIASIDKNISFVKEYIIVTSPGMLDEFKKLKSYYPIRIINENDILGEYAKNFKDRDHVSKNWLLRASLLNIKNLEDEFIMLDDDNRPLYPVDLNYYIDNGAYCCYYFDDLINWNHRNTEYDIGQIYNYKFLNKNSYELLQYSSHMPQIINKSIFKEAITKFFKEGLEYPIDEWSIYFNYAVSNYPMLFIKKKFQVMNWPEKTSHWEHSYSIDRYVFENYYRSVYTDGIFKGVTENDTEKKVELKWKERIPYDIAKNNLKDFVEISARNNMIHGIMKFPYKKSVLYLSSVPYLIASSTGAWIRLKVNYKMLNFDDVESVSIYYYLDGRKGYIRNLKIDKNSIYQEGIYEIPISTTSIQTGKYEILYDVRINSKHIYGLDSPYMSYIYVYNQSNEPLEFLDYKLNT